MIVRGFADEPPVSWPTIAAHVKSRVVLVEAVNVRRPGLVGSIPVIAFTLSEVQAESPIRFDTLILT